MNQLIKRVGLKYQIQTNNVVAGKIIWYVRLFEDLSIDWDIIWEARLSLKV